jgi:hypothetical protein
MQITIMPGTKKHCSENGLSAAVGLILGVRRKVQSSEGIEDTIPHHLRIGCWLLVLPPAAVMLILKKGSDFQFDL